VGNFCYVMIYYYDIEILTYKIYILHFHFPVRRTGGYRHKKALAISTSMSFGLCR